MTTRAILAGLLVLCTAGCSKNRQTDLVTFPLRGEIVRLDSSKGIVTVSHQAIPNYMNAMTMPFRVHDTGLLHGLNVGDSIAATLAVSRTESWLEQIAVLGKGPTPPPLTAEEIITARVFRTGEAFPGERLLNQDGTPVNTDSFRGKVLALTFVYTRCPLPDFCIRMSSHFASIQRALRKDAALAGKWHLFSVSFDPKFDRPAVLKRYAAEYGADFSTWDFLTDPDTSGPAIRRLADGLGLEYTADEGLIDHNLRTLLIDREGNLRKVINGNDWKPEDLAADIRKLAGGS